MKFTAIGPTRAGCHEIQNEIAEEFKRLGGEDIEVWDGENYTVFSKTQAAVDYAVEALDLQFVDDSPE